MTLDNHQVQEKDDDPFFNAPKIKVNAELKTDPKDSEALNTTKMKLCGVENSEGTMEQGLDVMKVVFM